MGRKKVVFASILLLVGLVASSSVWALEVTGVPKLTMDPNGATPLAGLIELETDVPTRVTLAISDGTDTWSNQFKKFQTVHAVHVLGLKPNSTYSLELTITDEGGESVVLTPELKAVTPPLPADFPIITVYHSDPSRMEPGFTLMDRFRRFGGEGGEYSIIIDNAGDVVWFSTFAGYDGQVQLPNGRLLQLDTSEIDLLGNVFEFRELDVPGLFLHHEMFPMKSGNFLSLTLELVTVDNYPTSETDPDAPAETQEIVSDAVVEFAPDGSLVNIWHLTDMLDPTRIGYDSTFPGFPLFGPPDWSHSNAVIHNLSDDSIIFSARHQDAVVKFSRATGEIIWILGPHDNWIPEFQQYLLKPVGEPFEFQFHQHAPMVTPAGTLLLFDNGNHRASPFDGNVPLEQEQSYSRAVEFAIDEETMEVRQVWEYRYEFDLFQFAPTQGDADWMPITGNVLITSTDTRFIAGIPTREWGLGLAHTSIREVDHNTPAQTVFDMRMYSPDSEGTIWAYRSERIPSLYGSDVLCTPETCVPGGARITCDLPIGVAMPGDTVDVDMYIENVHDLRGYQTGIAVTRTSGLADVAVGCPDGITIDTSNPNFVFFGAPDLIVAADCPNAKMAASLVSGSVDVGRTRRYLGSYTLQVPIEAELGSTFNVQVLPSPASALGDADSTAIPFEIGSACTLLIDDCLPLPYGDSNADGVVDLLDILCVLDGFAGVFVNCSESSVDIEPCGGNGRVDLFDIFAVLDAFSSLPSDCAGVCVPPLASTMPDRTSPTRRERRR